MPRRPGPKAAGGAPAALLRRPGWLTPELLLLPGGLGVAQATASPVPVLAAALAFLPLRRRRLRRAVAAEARQRATAVVDLCTALAGELRSGATPEQALHVVTTRLAEDGEALRRIGLEPVARLAAGRYGGDVPGAFQLLAELPGGRGATAIAACWRVTSDGGAGLAAGLDGVAEALRAERALAEEIDAELAAPRTTVAVLAALPVAGLLLGAALGARPVTVLLHTPAGLACLLGGAALEGLGVAWTARIVRAASRGALEDPLGGGRTGAEAGAGVRAGGGSGAGAGAGDGDRRDGGGWRCGISRTRARPGRPTGSFRAETATA
ncbi:type II secretion system F family protein [Kitasatospora sp. NPDC091207]|uniref:type II secretion system F family protein n=1 Tax=Kitasatospora sp. NPDC091207 TaxID=3364083 RepID=UPI00381BD939